MKVNKIMTFKLLLTILIVLGMTASCSKKSQVRKIHLQQLAGR